MVKEPRRFSIPSPVIDELTQLTEDTDISNMGEKAFLFYLRCSKLRQQGYVIAALPGRMTENADVVVDIKSPKDAVILNEY